jgi:hypothetical protein
MLDIYNLNQTAVLVSIKDLNLTFNIIVRLPVELVYHASHLTYIRHCLDDEHCV